MNTFGGRCHQPEPRDECLGVVGGVTPAGVEICPDTEGVPAVMEEAPVALGSGALGPEDMFDKRDKNETRES